MKKTICVAVFLAVFGGFTMLLSQSAQAQAAPPLLSLVGPGSSIGLTVRDADAGLVVAEVRPDSPASRSGLREGDVVTEFDGERARSAAQFTRLVRETAPGRTVKITVRRDGANRTLDVTPEARGAAELRLPDVTVDVPRGFARPRDFAFDFNFAEPWVAGPFSQRLGVTVAPLTPQLAAYFGVERGLLVSEVAPYSPAEAAGIKAGDVMTTVNGRDITTPDDLVKVVRESDAGASLEVRVMRDRRELTLSPKLPERTRPFAWRPSREV